MFKPKIKSDKLVLNIKPISGSNEDKIKGLKDIEMSDISLFVDDAGATSSCNLTDADLTLADLWNANLMGAYLYRIYQAGANLD